MTQSQMNIRNQIAQKIAQKRQSIEQPQVKAQSVSAPASVDSDTNFAPFLGAAIIFMSFAMIGVMFFYDSGSKANLPVIAKKSEPFRENIVDAKFVTHEDASNMMSNVDSRIARLEESVSIWKHRTWMLSVAHNENANIAKVIDQQKHGGKYGSSYIVFDHDWSMNRTPVTMDLTEQQKRNIKSNQP